MFLRIQEYRLCSRPPLGYGLHDLVVPVCSAGGLGQMGNAEDLDRMGQEGNFPGHLETHFTADAHIDFIEYDNM